jgi:pimeloyl-ACP methyl ester carboxylesterase
MQVVSTRVGKVAVEIAGQGPPLVLLHSIGHDHKDYDAILPALTEHFRTIAVDWPGHGESEMWNPPSSATVGLLCDSLEDVVAGLDLAPVILMGNSVGGTASIRFAARHPEQTRGLVLVDSGGLSGISPALRGMVCWVQGRELVRRATGMSFARSYLKTRGPEVTALLSRLATARERPGFIAMDAAMWRSFGTAEGDLAELAPAIRCSTLIVWGKHDPVLRAGIDGKRTRELLAHARYVELDTGHVPFVEKPDAFLATVLPFLEAARSSSEQGVTASQLDSRPRPG